MKRKFSLDFLEKSFNKLKRINKKPPRRESLALYREILKFSREFDWSDEYGQNWVYKLRESAWKEFEDAWEENDPVVIQ